MSSVFRGIAQRPTQLYHSEAGTQYWTAATIKSVLRDYDVVVNGSVYTFESEEVLVNAMAELDASENGTTAADAVFTDMGKSLLFGVAGAANDYFTFRLVKYTNSAAASDAIFYVVIDAKVTRTYDAIRDAPNPDSATPKVNTWRA